VYLVVLPQARWQTSPESPCPLKRPVGRSTWRPTTLRPAGALFSLSVMPVQDNQPSPDASPPSRRRYEVFEPPSPPPQVGDLRAEGGAAAIMGEAAAARRTCGPTARPSGGGGGSPLRGEPPPPAGPDVVVDYGPLDIMYIFARVYLQNSYAGCLQM